MIVILHNIRSLHNVGSIFRTADAVGAEKIYLSGITPAPVDEFGKPRPQFTKVSLAAEKYVGWERSSSIIRLMDGLKRNGYKIFAIEQSRRSVPYYTTTCSSIPKKDIKGKKRRGSHRVGFCNVALVAGSEISGLPEWILRQCDKILEIPMRGRKESLNVAVAFGIVAYFLRFEAH